ncbi:hypothetical protein CISG_02171 [Coccidioides immitis RMSCC 3703]|uniref:Uncharacterized protein n=1 Tax=Coccidioides immitis RMSCC 3703 TaxID=454286 RepID=A0A0J8R792_COCIT|nr:hypothetical protein CISG_02171 [Coccidioides immitis RMSCC 3703]
MSSIVGSGVVCTPVWGSISDFYLARPFSQTIPWRQWKHDISAHDPAAAGRTGFGYDNTRRLKSHENYFSKSSRDMPTVLPALSKVLRVVVIVDLSLSFLLSHLRITADPESAWILRESNFQNVRQLISISWNPKTYLNLVMGGRALKHPECVERNHTYYTPPVHLIHILPITL